MNYPAYPNYGPQETDWFGYVPSHWKILQLKRIVDTKITDGPHETPDFVDEGVPFISAEAVKGGRLDFSKKRAFISQELHDQYCRKVHPQRGDVLIVKSGATTGNIAIVDTDAEFSIWSPLALVRTQRKAIPEYTYSFLQSLSFKTQVELGWSFGTQQNIGMGVIENLWTLLPPLDEQAAIANFLDRETAKIDTLIEKQEQLISLLEEKRQAVISRAVTKGLNPDVRMKDSGVEWLGKIPDHWKVSRVGQLFAESNEGGNTELPVLSVSIHHGVSDKELTNDELDRKVSRIEDRSKYKRVHPYDLTYNMMRAWQGGFGAVMVDGLVSPAYVVACPRTKADTRYFEMLLRTPNAITEMHRHSKGITDFRLRLYWDEFKRLHLAVPPIEEIRLIVEAVADHQKVFDEIVSTSRRFMELLKERRTALISGVVTGKIDVRNAV